MTIFAIDPGTTQSAYVIWDGQVVQEADIRDNEELLDILIWHDTQTIRDVQFVCEKIASYGLPVGESVFQTVFWCGRFFQALGENMILVPRKEVKLHLCQSSRANDSNIIQALKDRFGEKPTKKRPNPVFGDTKLKKDEWQAFALAVTYFDTHAEEENA